MSVEPAGPVGITAISGGNAVVMAALTEEGLLYRAGAERQRLHADGQQQEDDDAAMEQGAEP